MSLSDYLIDTSALLHDTSFLLTSQFLLTRYINQARDQVARDSGCLRALIAGNAPVGTGATPGGAVPGGLIPGMQPANLFQTVANQELYSYALANEYLTQQYRGYRAVIDVYNVGVSWGGSVRPVMGWLPWAELQAYGRSYNYGITSYPFLFSDTGTSENGRIWLWPPPSSNTEMEWDCFCVPAALNTANDYDAIPSNFRGAVRFYAAHLAYYGSNRFGMADQMLDRYYQQIGTSQASSARARVPDWYLDQMS
jgi:hypothetical protein